MIFSNYELCLMGYGPFVVQGQVMSPQELNKKIFVTDFSTSIGLI